jgi:putative sterol carrier protein
MRRPMTAYPFLSDEWVEAAHRIRAEFRDRTPPTTSPVRMNLVVTEVPFGEGELYAHMDTNSGELELDRGHLENADLQVTVDYATLKAILVDGDAQAATVAFLSGKVRVEGDMAKLMDLVQSASGGETAKEMATRLRDITQ